MMKASGFTLLELLIVMVMISLILGMISLNLMPGDQQTLRQDAQRIALLLQLVRDEAIVRNAPIAFESDGNQYHFLLLQEGVWNDLQDDELLHAREFKLAPVTLRADPASVASQSFPLRIVFGREPVGTPFTLSLAAGDTRAVINVDGIGHFTVD